MGPEVAFIGAFFAWVTEYGPWSIVVYGLWMIGTRRLMLAREYDRLADEADRVADKAKARETELVGEVEFWRSRHLQMLDVAQTAMGALSSGGQRRAGS